MHRPLRTYVLAALAAVLVGMFENILFGRDTPGTAHDISILFFFIFAGGLVALFTCGVIALARRVRRRDGHTGTGSTSR